MLSQATYTPDFRSSSASHLSNYLEFQTVEPLQTYSSQNPRTKTHSHISNPQPDLSSQSYESLTQYLSELKSTLSSLPSKHSSEKQKLNEEFLLAELQNSKLKNEALMLQTEILELNNSLQTFKKTTLAEAHSEVQSIKASVSTDSLIQSTSRSISLKNIDSNLQYLQEKLFNLQNKVHKSQLKLIAHKTFYSQKLSSLQSSLYSIHYKIESLESDTFNLSTALQSLKSQNFSTSRFIFQQKTRLQRLQQKNFQLFTKFSSLQTKVIKKPFTT